MNEILDDESERYCEIYVIKNTENGKEYVGQAVSHILNHKRYRPYGSIGRFKCHVSEAYSSKRKQCRLLNNAIRKYGEQNFTVSVINTCNLSNADEQEKLFILERNSISPNGYNLTFGGNRTILTEENRIQVSKGICKYYAPLKFKRFETIKYISDDIETYIRPLNRNGCQYGWYVYIDGKKADFGGSHISLCESKQRAIEFIFTLKEILAKHLDAGNS